jgi:hypothetical protein
MVAGTDSVARITGRAPRCGADRAAPTSAWRSSRSGLFSSDTCPPTASGQAGWHGNSECPSASSDARMTASLPLGD